MIGIIVSGHGNFADGITSALELIIGKQENYVAVNFPFGDTATELEANIDLALASLNKCENILIFTDLLGGSPFNISIMRAMKCLNIKVMYGTNLGMLIESAMSRNMNVPFESIVSSAIDIGKKQVGIFDAAVIDNEEDNF